MDATNPGDDQLDASDINNLYQLAEKHEEYGEHRYGRLIARAARQLAKFEASDPKKDMIILTLKDRLTQFCGSDGSKVPGFPLDILAALNSYEDTLDLDDVLAILQSPGVRMNLPSA